MRILQLILLVVLSIPRFIWADTEENFEQEMKHYDAEFKKAERQIPKIIEKYATAIGCEFSLNPSNIIPFRVGESDGYVAIYSLDLGCSGGSNMVMTIAAYPESHQRRSLLRVNSDKGKRIISS